MGRCLGFPRYPPLLYPIVIAEGKAGSTGAGMTALKTLLFTMIAPGSLTVLVPWWLLRGRWGGWRYDLWPADVLGWAMIGAGAGLYLWCAWWFTFMGEGTPAPIDPPKKLVGQGPYRICRNPMYVAVVTVLLGESICFGAPVLLGLAVLVFTAFHAFVRFYEEPHLRGVFGEEYERFCAAVPRWPWGARGRLISSGGAGG